MVDPTIDGTVNNQDQAREKAATLIEALPWLMHFHDRILVVKFGGNAMLI